MVLPEDGPLDDIVSFFAERSFRVVTHEEPPPEPTPEEWRRMPALVRRAMRHHRPPFWADLEQVETGELVRRYGGGLTPEAAIRSARSRWRIEEGDDV